MSEHAAFGKRFSTGIILPREGLLVAGIIAAQLLGPPAGRFTLAFLSIWALRSRTAAIQALTIGTLVVFISPGIAPADNWTPMLKWVLVLLSTYAGGPEHRRFRESCLAAPAFGVWWYRGPSERLRKP